MKTDIEKVKQTIWHPATLRKAMAYVDRERAYYCQHREKYPEDHWHHNGSFDNTPSFGPGYVIGLHRRQFIVVWGFYKHEWMSRWNYVLGSAVNARGERSLADNFFDIRDLPPIFDELKDRISIADNYLELVSELLGLVLEHGIELLDYTVDKAK